MTSNLVELRPNRRLLDHGFEGYKLNLNSLPQHRFNLQSDVDRLYPDDIQYSFIHAKLFALQNHLVPDLWDHAFNFYYIDKNQQVRNITFENINNTIQQAIVYDVPASEERKSGNFNLCLQFPSSHLAVISDGRGYLHIVDTGTRNKPATEKSQWQTIHSTLALEGKYFVIVDTRVQDTDCKEVLHCLLQSVEQNEKHFNSVLTWITLENEGQGWKQVATRQIQGKGIVHYAAFEVGCTAIYIASDNLFKFTSDSERDIIMPSKEQPRQIIYTWLQTAEDITITLQLENKFNKNLLHVNVTPLTIKVSYAGKDFVNGKLSHKVDSELTTWNVQDNGQVDVLITKAESMLWDGLIEGGDSNGEQIMDATLVEDTHRRLAHLCSETEVTDKSVIALSTQELEECDAASEEDTVLVRLDATHHMVTHRVPLSVHQYLFTQQLEIQQAPALCLRHDVDACIWQPYPQLVNSDSWPIKHHGTLMAFGYVQSSKQNRKFITCPANFSYAVVSEATRHIFIYKNTANTDCQLRKRTEGTMKSVKVGQQNVINVEKNGEVLGINATNEYLFVLTQSVFLAIEVQ
ncbi:nudC domain-containing protein 1 [Leptidea sinapis]|uniref:nudC domain-containing protein 1 n=1 Tax=Leptidea sinapis TaxID=189913 RepID=UPI00213ACD25|nr:nudC domain-containing protein 1 [Leptidea sinapis]